jgi:hypothetical protein
LTHDDFVDPLALDPGPLQRGLDRRLAEFVRREVGECPVESADRCAGSTYDDDIVLHRKLLWRSVMAGQAPLCGTAASFRGSAGLSTSVTSGR